MNWSGLQAFSQHSVLSSLFLEHVIAIVNQTPLLKVDTSKGESTTTPPVDVYGVEDVLQAAVIALTAFFRSIFNYVNLSFVATFFTLLYLFASFKCRGGGKVGRRAVEQSYASVFVTLLLHFGACHGLASSVQLEPLRLVLVKIVFVIWFTSD